MKRLLVFLIFVSTSLAISTPAAMAASPSETFAAIWWNVGGGNYYQNPVNRENCYADEGRNLVLLQKNILKLAQSKPDALMLGEMYEGFFSAETMKQLSILFPSLRRYRYNARDSRPLEVWVFSKQVPTDERYIFEELHWADLDTERTSNSNFLRSYQRVTFEFAGRKINLVPVHAVDPWPEMRGERGLIRTGLNLIFSNKNASYVQAGYLKRALNLDLLQDQRKETTLLLGDFNIPNHVLGIIPRAYARLQAGLSAIPLFGKTKHTFPSAKCLQYTKLPKLQIDHVFAKNLEGEATGSILSELGSDHFPIQVKIKIGN